MILPASTGLLTEIADVLLKNPRIRKVEVQGHTDGTGSPAHNMKLSEDRASSVVAWLTAHGVALGALDGEGLRRLEASRPERHGAEQAAEPPRSVHHHRAGCCGGPGLGHAPSPLGAPALGAPALGSGAAPGPKPGPKPAAPTNPITLP